MEEKRQQKEEKRKQEEERGYKALGRWFFSFYWRIEMKLENEKEKIRVSEKKKRAVLSDEAMVLLVGKEEKKEVSLNDFGLRFRM